MDNEFTPIMDAIEKLIDEIVKCSDEHNYSRQTLYRLVIATLYSFRLKER